MPDAIRIPSKTLRFSLQILMHRVSLISLLETSNHGPCESDCPEPFIEKLRAGYGPDGRRDPHAAFWLRFLTSVQKQAGVRFGKYRFKRQPGAPDPDSRTITLTGKHIPATLRRALDWCLQRYGLTE